MTCVSVASRTCPCQRACGTARSERPKRRCSTISLLARIAADRRAVRGGGLPGMKVIENWEALGALIELGQVAFEGQQAERPPWRTNSATTRISEASG